MLWLITVSAILSGVDNLQACSALGLVAMRSRQRTLYALAFSASEILAPLFGLLLGNVLFTTVFHEAQRYSPIVMLVCGLGVLALAMKKRNVAALLDNPGVLVGLPVSLSIDNFLVGIGLSSTHAPIVLSALIIGATGAAMSCAGLYLGGRLRSFLPQRIEVLAGIYLCLLSLRMWMKG